MLQQIRSARTVAGSLGIAKCFMNRPRTRGKVIDGKKSCKSTLSTALSGSCHRRRRPDAPGHLIRSRRRPQRQLSPRRAQELSASRLRDEAPLEASSPGIVRAYALVSSAGPGRRCSGLRVIGAVACGASLCLPIAAYHEALHAGSTEPAALTLRYPLLIRDAVDEPL